MVWIAGHSPWYGPTHSYVVDTNCSSTASGHTTERSFEHITSRKGTKANIHALLALLAHGPIASVINQGVLVDTEEVTSGDSRQLSLGVQKVFKTTMIRSSYLPCRQHDTNDFEMVSDQKHGGIRRLAQRHDGARRRICSVSSTHLQAAFGHANLSRSHQRFHQQPSRRSPDAFRPWASVRMCCERAIRRSPPTYPSRSYTDMAPATRLLRRQKERVEE
ncbi:hypothetical protein BKA58DRAFT_397534 [Alternaria rosae]|uniref:uncharacterized protein n=1 Tax=Alternaria rosae TaxID=1187941 RepID=UPI001E8D6278|nr:uncharacterized protein BKA58DRAFT_397534 [Alternaria rosae]KAH6883335.1 hypothetical protein BKA58DRAFT_397534 [Alternaria rosae]